ncbi:MAG: ABC transporter permease [Candidatus Dormibacteraceae bacterium]
MNRARMALPFAEGLLFVVAVLAVWQLWSSTSQPPPVYYPSPQRIVSAAWNYWLSVGGINKDILPSLARVLLGWALATVIGIVVGLAIGLVRPIAGFVDPVVQFMRAVPPPVVLPVFMILLGIEGGMKVAFIAFGVVWPVLLNTVKGVRSVEPMQLETATALRIHGLRRVLTVILPSAAPDIFAGLRIALSLSLVLMVLSEMIAASGGIGFRILNSQATFNITGMWGAIGVLAISGVLLNGALTVFESRLLRWHSSARAHG